jgi:hypothetical protein
MVILVTVLSIPFLSFYWLALARVILDAAINNGANWITPLSVVLYFPFAFFAYIFFASTYSFITVTVVTIAAATVGLKWGHFNQFSRVWLMLIICAVVTFPFVYRYQPALTATPGNEMQLVTDPGLLGGIVKASQNLTEQTPCTYKLLGWSKNNQLYYRAVCNSESRIWRYSPAHLSQIQMSVPPSELSSMAVSDDTVMSMVWADGVKPKRFEQATRPLLLESKGLMSPDKQWTAIVTQHIYGTQDVIILTEQD